MTGGGIPTWLYVSVCGYVYGHVGEQSVCLYG